MIYRNGVGLVCLVECVGDNFLNYKLVFLKFFFYLVDIVIKIIIEGFLMRVNVVFFVIIKRMFVDRL